MGAKKPLSLQAGHLTKKQIMEKELEEKNKSNLDTSDLNNIPSWLINDIARNEWTRLIKEMSKSSMICNLDYNNLGAYCNAFARWQFISNKLKLNLLAGSKTNPLITLEHKYSDEMKKYSVLLGLTYEAKLKAMQNLAENERNTIEDEFGDI